jgi:hypothetical protein
MNNEKPFCVEYERLTFEHLWAESGKDSEEARHLMRSPQKVYYEEDRAGKTQLEHMPDVTPPPKFVTLYLLVSVPGF